MAGKIKQGDVVVIRYEARGGPGMQEMLSPTSALVGMGLDSEVALLTDGRFPEVHGVQLWTYFTTRALESGAIIEGDLVKLICLNEN